MLMTRQLNWMIVSVAVMCCLAGEARAAILFDNLSATSDGTDSVDGFGPLADSFSTGTSATNLLGVKLLLSGTSNGGSINVLLLSDAATNPGSVLTTIGTLSDASLTGIPNVFDFVLSSPYALSANTRYWVELTSTNSSGATWNWSYDVTGVGVASEFNLYDGAVTANSATGVYQMQVLTAVPEPASLTLVAIGGLGLGFVANRRRRPKQSAA